MKPFDHEKGVAFLRDRFVPFAEAKLHIASSPVLYGLAIYTVFSLNWNEKERKLYVFRLRDHYDRLVNSAKIMGFEAFAENWPYEKFEKIARELVEKNKITEDALVRVTVFVDAVIAGTKIKGLPIALSAYVYPLGQILPPAGIHLCVSSWRRNPDDAIPSRAKINGGYVNACLMKNEAIINGYDDAVALDHDGHVTEGTVANIFLVRNGKLITPSPSADMLEGITRDSIMKVAGDLGIQIEERLVDRTELYVADEVFICGSSARIVPVLSIDRRPIGSARGTASGAGTHPTSITSKLAQVYRSAQNGTEQAYSQWRMEVQ